MEDFAAPLMIWTPGWGSLAHYQMAQHLAFRNGVEFPVCAVPSLLGFKAKKIRKHKIKTVVAHTDTFYSSKGIFIPQHVARHFTIREIYVGNVCVYKEHEGFPAELLLEETVFIALPIVGPNQQIRMKVHNHSCRAHWFRAAIEGVAFR